MRNPGPYLFTFFLFANLSYSSPDSLSYFIPETEDGIQLTEYLSPDSLRKLDYAKRNKTIDQSISIKTGLGLGLSSVFANDHTLDTFSMARLEWDLALEVSFHKNLALGINYRRNTLIHEDHYAPLKGSSQSLLPYISFQFYPNPIESPQSMAFLRLGYGPSWHRYSELPLDIRNISSDSRGKMAFIAFGFSGRSENGFGGFVEFEISSEFMDHFYQDQHFPVFSQSRTDKLLDVNYLGCMVKLGILLKGRMGNSVLPKY